MEKVLESRSRKEYHFGIRSLTVSLEDRKQMEQIQVKHMWRVGVILGASGYRYTGHHHGEWATAFGSSGWLWPLSLVPHGQQQAWAGGSPCLGNTQKKYSLQFKIKFLIHTLPRWPAPPPTPSLQTSGGHCIKPITSDEKMSIRESPNT